MSQENVETVRRAYEVAYAERSVEGVMDVVAENFVWHQRAEWPGLPCTGLKTCRSFGRTLTTPTPSTALFPSISGPLASTSWCPSGLALVCERAMRGSTRRSTTSGTCATAR